MDYLKAFLLFILKWLVAVAAFWLLAVVIVWLSKIIPAIYPSVTKMQVGIFLGNSILVILVMLLIFLQVRYIIKKKTKS